jgi:1-acyl-sn-glycerol-3-phosphate acyltransferase
MIYYVCRFIFYLIFKIFFHSRVYGKENIPKKGGFIIASNHISYIDPAFIGVAAGRSLRYMARHDLFKNYFFAWILYHWRVFPVKRDSPDLAALKTALHFLKKGEGLLLFPEGARQTNGLLNKPQPGVGFIAAKSNAPIIPAYVRGTEKALPKGRKKLKLAQIQVRFGKQIHIERSMPYQDIAQLIMGNIRQLSCLA